MHLERLIQHIKAGLTVLGVGGEHLVSVRVLLTGGSGVTTISEELVIRIQAEMPRVTLSTRSRYRLGW